MRRSSRTSSSNRTVTSLASDLNGFLELGGTSEAQRLVRRVLRHPGLTAAEFFEAIRAIGAGPNSKKWRGEVEAAHGRLGPKQQRLARTTMLNFYYTIGDAEAALKSFSLRDVQTPAEAFMAMDVLLDCGKLKEAKMLARKAEKTFNIVTDSFETSCLIHAVASYYARTRNWRRAREVWFLAPRNQPLARDAATGIVQTFIAGALDAISGELKTVRDLKRIGPTSSELMLSLPGVEETLLKDTEKDLLRLQRGLERLVPKERRWALGLTH